jgi:hypothetical protein
VSTIVVLMGLLLLSYVGSFVTSGGRGVLRGAGLPSGSEFLALGVLAGPLVFGGVTREALEAFDPITYVAIGWLALSSGLEYGNVEGRRVGFARLFEGLVLTLLSGAAVAAAAWFVLPLVAPISRADRILLTGGLACVCAETTTQAIRWIRERYRARGPLSDLLSELAHSDDLVPVVTVAWLYALRTPPRAMVHLPPVAWGGATVGVGIVLGVLAVLLLARDLRVAESWGTLLGTSLMAVGLAARLDLAAVTAMFALGATIAFTSRHRGDVRAMIRTTERTVLLPMLVLAGARIDPSSIGRLGWIIPVAIAVRVISKLVVGVLVQGHRVARGGGVLLGLAQLSSGGVSVALGLAFALRFPGVGDVVLATAVASTAIGEIAGPVALRQLLTRAGEVAEAPPSVRAPASGAPPSTSAPAGAPQGPS